jgi:hypothetical protein
MGDGTDIPTSMSLEEAADARPLLFVAGAWVRVLETTGAWPRACHEVELR